MYDVAGECWPSWGRVAVVGSLPQIQQVLLSERLAHQTVPLSLRTTFECKTATAQLCTVLSQAQHLCMNVCRSSQTQCISILNSSFVWMQVNPLCWMLWLAGCPGL